jgi:hypothetical protein
VIDGLDTESTLAFVAAFSKGGLHAP